MLLIDQNLPKALAEALVSFYPGTKHVKELGMERETDTSLWNYASENDFVIVTKDSDFYDRLTLKGYPPKLIWVRTGNVSTDYLIQLFQSRQAGIKAFLENPDMGYLELL